ncbi:WXG100 family type VII secretion target [Luethyella okanaganae]|uniref:ESAT-6-like protein n=1 Tax=Luethyella okanaganae TaxID=69372 RepID=A0ABW1VHQ7_9MICO
MTRYTVDSDEVLTTTTAVHGCIDRIRAETSGLTSLVANLQGSWTGQAASAFQAAASEWRAVQQQLEESLCALNRSLGAAGQHYADIEQANANLFAR